ncbi:MAG TPA: aldehyde dehydrogenase family protein [Mycobacteriales bacterium]|nr:aldehyde dehydrogenase family protein [Mycobacteriales bacterium]
MPTLDPLPLLIDGAWRASLATETLTVLDPGTDRPVSCAPDGCAADVDAAVGAAGKAAPGWARTSPAERAAVLKAAARRLRGCVDELAALTTSEMGKPLGDARGGVEAGIGAIERYAELGPLHGSRSLQGGYTATDLMVREPRGVAAVITPWNDPVAIACQNLAAVLVTGNTAVFKSSERTPGTGVRVAELVAADLPPGVLNVVLGGARAGASLAAHPDVDVVLHVGSTAAGARDRRGDPRTGAKAVLENGGKDPLVVDPGWAAAQAALGAFANAGQICVAVERVYAHAELAEPFLAALVAEAQAWVLGPLVDCRHREAVHAQVADAIARGARLLAGGAVPAGPGAFYPPTVLADCTDDMTLMSAETFGPVAPVRVVGLFDEALAAASRSAYGLAHPRPGARAAGLAGAAGRQRQDQRGVRRGARRGGPPAPGQRRGVRLRPRTARRGDPDQGRPLDPAARRRPPPRQFDHQA